MYKIIGADQKEYGPITADQIIHWIQERRVNAQTQARMEGGQDWLPLSAFPEFAAALGLAPAGAPPPLTSSVPGATVTGGREAALNAVKGPAIALIVTAGLDILLGILGLFQQGAARQLYATMPQFQDPQFQKLLQFSSGPVVYISVGFHVIVCLIIILGAVQMLSLKSYTLAFVAAVLAVIPCITPCCGLVTLGFGIWALVVLNKPGIKNQFA